VKVRIKIGGHHQQTAPALPAAMPLAAPAAAAMAPAASASPDEGGELAIVKSPIVGTFYRAAEPAAKPFVSVGDTVRKGQVLCIIEAMKLMNEIDSEYDGEVTSIYIENGQAVQYGERLFAIKPAS
jgi:acetyl-CoA carboxylase biotin carboxyl carrier protein